MKRAQYNEIKKQQSEEMQETFRYLVESIDVLLHEKQTVFMSGDMFEVRGSEDTKTFRHIADELIDELYERLPEAEW